MDFSRRSFMKGAAGAGVAGSLAGLDALLPFSRIKRVDAAVTPDMVRFTPEIEPLVRLIEDTPRADCVEVLAREIRGGVTHRQFLAALFLAGIRNINPQPPGFKFHCVFVIHSANYLSLMSPPAERLLPLFWAMDDFKKSQEQDIESGDFTLRQITGNLPTGAKAWSEFHAAMKDWDEPRADRAITALAREAEPAQLFEALWEYGARDYRNIGHKPIFVANAFRTLQTIGWQHAEPTVRSIALALLDFGKSERVNAYAFDDQAYHGNVALVEKWTGELPGDWAEQDGNPSITLELLDPLRRGAVADACELAVQRLADGSCKAGAVWDAVHLAGGELMMRQPGIAGLHTLTSANGLRYAFRTSAVAKTRLLMLLQGLGFICQFRKLMNPSRDNNARITEIPDAELSPTQDSAAEEILSIVASEKDAAAQKAYAYGQRFAAPDVLFQAARHLVFTKASEHHQLKWPAAIFEDFHLVSPRWRPHMLATSMYYLRGTEDRDSPVVERAIEALKRA